MKNKKKSRPVTWGALACHARTKNGFSKGVHLRQQIFVEGGPVF